MSAPDVKAFRLVAGQRDGRPYENLGPLPDGLQQMCDATAAHYDNVGFTPPWTGYFAVIDGVIMGGGAFVTPPAQNRVEIAYFTLDAYQGQGVASQTAAALVALARREQPNIELFAKTLPGSNASTTVLKRLGFREIGPVPDDEIGEAAGWLLPV